MKLSHILSHDWLCSDHHNSVWTFDYSSEQVELRSSGISRMVNSLGHFLCLLCGMPQVILVLTTHLLNIRFQTLHNH